MSGRVLRRVFIRGRVQGVGYRDWTRRAARERGLEGWVRNRKDDRVEALFVGTPEAVAEMIGACRVGPPSALVESIEEYEATETELALREGQTFPILHTA
jgi:acylphosphatase